MFSCNYERKIRGFGMKFDWTEKNFPKAKDFGISIHRQNHESGIFFFDNAMSDKATRAEIRRLAGFEPDIKIVKTIYQTPFEKKESTVTTETYEPRAIENKRNIEEFCKLYGFSINDWDVLEL